MALENGKIIATKILKTTGVPAGVRLTPDRKDIKANRNDLSYVKVEVIDKDGNLIPNANIPLTFKVSGVGEIAGSGNACPTDMESFNNSICNTYRGQALVILRPTLKVKQGNVKLIASANGLKTGEISISVK